MYSTKVQKILDSDCAYFYEGNNFSAISKEKEAQNRPKTTEDPLRRYEAYVKYKQAEAHLVKNSDTKNRFSPKGFSIPPLPKGRAILENI